MPSEDPKLKELEAQLARLKHRKKEIEQAEDKDIRERFLAPLKRNIKLTQREIRKRKYVLSSKKQRPQGSKR
jgi:hypothetical protein